MADSNCVHFVPFRHYDWTFRHVGPLAWNPTAFCIIAAFCSAALWMVIELFVQVFFTFKRHKGLYFWSIVITTWGIALQITGYLLKEFSHSAPKVLVTIICKVGWVSNVTGFSVVLYSRLHLVVRNPKVLNLVLAMIITDAILFHTPVVVFEFGLISSLHDTYVYPMEIMERIQQTGFTIQETVISSLYIAHTARFFKGDYTVQTRKVIALLIAVQSLVIGLDAGLTTFDYMNMFTLKCTIHPFVYSVKLKLEFVVLNQLLNLVKHGLAPGNFPAPDEEESSEGEGSPPPRRKRLLGFSGKMPWSRSWTPSTKAMKTRHESPNDTAIPSSPTNDTQHITKTDEVTLSYDPILKSADIPSAVVRQDSDTTLQGDDIQPANKTELRLEPCTSLDDTERQYLGRFGVRRAHE